jgi:hypothetical protein
MFAEARTDSFQALMRKKIASLLNRLRGSSNGILGVIAEKYDCPILKYWVSQIKAVAQFRVK